MSDAFNNLSSFSTPIAGLQAGMASTGTPRTEFTVLGTQDGTSKSCLYIDMVVS